MLEKISQWYERKMLALAEYGKRAFQSRYGLWFLGFISIVESSLLVPIITDPFLAGYILANRRNVQKAILVTTLASVLGGVIAYLAAVYVFEFFISNFISISQTELEAMATHFETGTFLITIIGAVTPVPYTVVAIAAGTVKANLLIFIVASLVGRGFRYALVGILTHFIGPRALLVIQKHIRTLTIVLLILFFVYVALQFIHVS